MYSSFCKNHEGNKAAALEAQVQCSASCGFSIFKVIPFKSVVPLKKTGEGASYCIFDIWHMQNA